jgi:hypothetical protein
MAFSDRTCGHAERASGGTSGHGPPNGEHFVWDLAAGDRAFEFSGPHDCSASIEGPFVYTPGPGPTVTIVGRETTEVQIRLDCP